MKQFLSLLTAIILLACNIAGFGYGLDDGAKKNYPQPTTVYRFTDASSPTSDAYGQLPLTVTGGTFSQGNLAITSGTAIASTASYMSGQRKFTGYMRFIPATTSAFSVDFINFTDPSFVDATSYSWYIDPGNSGSLAFGYANGLDGNDYGFQLDSGNVGLDTTNIFHVMFGYMERTNGTSRAFMYVYKSTNVLGNYTKVFSDSMYSANASNSAHRLHLTTATFYSPLKIWANQYIEDPNMFTKLIQEGQ